MPFPFLNFRSELDPTTRKELDEMAANLTEWLSKEHHSDGTHGDITADSIVVNGDLTVHGFTGFEDLSGNSITANDITVATLTVSAHLQVHDLAVSATGSIADLQVNNSQELGGSSANTSKDDRSVFAANGGIVAINNFSTTDNNWSEITFYTRDSGIVGATTEVARYGVQYTSHAAGALAADHVWKKTSNTELMRLTSAGAFLINTNKFTVDGATGNTIIAGTGEVDGELSLGGVLKDGVWPSNFAETGRRWGQIADSGNGLLIIANGQSGVAVDRAGDIYLGARGTTGAGDLAYVILRGARESAASGNFSTYFAVRTEDAAQTEHERLRLSSAGLLQLSSYGSGYLNTDGSGNVSATAGVPLVQNGVNFGPAPVASVTVVNGQVTNIS